MGKSESPTAVIGLACFVAFACPFLFGYGTLPLTNYAGEIVSLTGFATMLLVVARYGQLSALPGPLRLYWAALGTLTVTMCAQYWYFGQQNLMPWVTAGGYFLLAGLAAWIGRAARTSRYDQHWLRGLAIGVLVGAILASLAATAQYLKLDASVVVLSPVAHTGRTFGFIRQPNHQATFLSFGLVAIFVLLIKSKPRLGNLLLFVVSPLIVFGIVSTGSRTGLIQLIFISVCALPFLLANGQSTWKALYPPFLAGVVWLVLFLLDRNGAFGFYGVAKLAQTASEGVGLRSAVWRETIDLIATRPWFGWGIPAYGPVFYLSGGAERAGIVMSHSHNLFLQLAFAFGIPALALVTFLIGKILWNSRRQLLTAEGFLPLAAVGCVLIHSQVEFPLWYLYFLLPSSFFLGWISVTQSQIKLRDSSIDLGNVIPPMQINTAAQKGLAGLVAACTIGVAVWVNSDYYKITPVFVIGLKADLSQRMEVARTNTWFRYYADYVDLVRQPVDRSNYQKYLDRLANSVCSMHEIWFQPKTILALIYAGKIDDAKWAMFSYWRLSGGNIEQFKNAIAASDAPLAAEFIQYLESPVPVAQATSYFDNACYRRNSR